MTDFCDVWINISVIRYLKREGFFGILVTFMHHRLQLFWGSPVKHTLLPEKLPKALLVFLAASRTERLCFSGRSIWGQWLQILTDTAICVSYQVWQSDFLMGQMKDRFTRELLWAVTMNLHVGRPQSFYIDWIFMISIKNFKLKRKVT